MNAIQALLSACILFLALSGTKEAGQDNEEQPDFTGPIRNVTVALGREAVLSCSVTKLGQFKVGWLKAEDQTILSLHNRVVTHNARVSVTHENQKTWKLHIRQLKESDRGCYMCQINTNIMKKQFGCVDVRVPPDIIDTGTSSDVTVNEGDNASLMCRARGHPHPRIIWRREDGQTIALKNHKENVESYMGDNLILTKVDRHQMGAYLCIASNDVPPAVSKRIALYINFAPVIKVPNQLLGSAIGKDVVIRCTVEAYPHTINYWLKNRNQMLLSGSKHIIEEEKHSYRVNLKLIVKKFNSSDIGAYSCVSTNSLGKAEGAIRLYEIKILTTTTTTTTTPESLISFPSTLKITTAQVTTSLTTEGFLRKKEDNIIMENEVDKSSSVQSGRRNPRPRQHFFSSSNKLSSHLCLYIILFIFR